MGYQTNFELEVIDGDMTVAEVLSENEDFEGIDYALDENGETSGAVKWYSHEADMTALSAKYPEITFLLSGEGEEQGDVWRKYFRNGKSRSIYAKLTFPEFYANSLKEAIE